MIFGEFPHSWKYCHELELLAMPYIIICLIGVDILTSALVQKVKDITLGVGSFDT